MTAAEKELIADLQSALAECMSDLESWATSGPDGMTAAEKKRFRRYDAVCDQALTYLHPVNAALKRA